MSSNSNFLFSPANPTNSNHFAHSQSHSSHHSHPNHGHSQAASTRSNLSQQHLHQHQHQPDTSSSPSSSRDSNQNPFSFSCSSSSSQSLQSNASWQTDNTSFANSNSPTEAPANAKQPGSGQRDPIGPSSASGIDRPNDPSSQSRPNSSSGNASNSATEDGNHHGNHQHHDPNLSFTHTFPRFNHDLQSNHHHHQEVGSNRQNPGRSSHSNHSTHPNLDQQSRHRLSYDSAAAPPGQHHHAASPSPQSGQHQAYSSLPYEQDPFNSQKSLYQHHQHQHQHQHQQEYSFDPYANLQNQPQFPTFQPASHHYGGQGSTASPTPRPRVTTTLWEDEGTLCYQVDSKGVCVARRHDNNMINGTKLLNVVSDMSRGRRDTILKMEKSRVVVKSGSMHLKGVWIAFEKAKQLAESNKIIDGLYPLFEDDISAFLYTPENYQRTNAVMAAARKRNEVRAQENAEFEKKGGKAVRNPKSKATQARKQSLEGQISEVTAPRSALPALEASRSRAQGGGPANSRPPADLAQLRSHSYSGTSSNPHSMREMGPPINSSHAPSSEFSFTLPHGSGGYNARPDSTSAEQPESTSPSNKAPPNLYSSGLPSLPMRSSSDRRLSMPVRPGETEDPSPHRFAEPSFPNAVRGLGSSFGTASSPSQLNMMSPSHATAHFGMDMAPNPYSSPNLPQHQQQHQQQYYSNSPDLQHRFQPQLKHQGVFPIYTTSNNANAHAQPFPDSTPSSNAHSRAASVSSSGDHRASNLARSVSREQYQGNPNMSNYPYNGINQDYQQQQQQQQQQLSLSSSPSSVSQGPTSGQFTGRSHSLSHPNSVHRGSISSTLPPIYTQPSTEHGGSNSSADPSPISTGSSGLKRSRSSLGEDDQPHPFGMNLSHPHHGIHSAHPASNVDFDAHRRLAGRISNDEDGADADQREMKRSRSGGSNPNSFNELTSASISESTYL